MSDKKPRTKQKSKPAAPQMTAEEFAAIKAQREAEAKQHAEDMARYSKRVDKMTHRQLKGELRNIVRKEHGAAGLTAAFGVVLGIVLKDTETPENPFAKLGCYPR